MLYFKDRLKKKQYSVDHITTIKPSSVEGQLTESTDTTEALHGL